VNIQAKILQVSEGNEKSQLFRQELALSYTCFLPMQKFVITALIVSLFSFSAGSKTIPGNFTHTRSESDNCKSSLDVYLKKFYKGAGLREAGLEYSLFRNAVVGYYNLKKQDKARRPVISVIDFGLPSTRKRMWIIDLKKKQLLEHTLVAHGKNSGENFAVNFSNTPNSYMSSLGFYVTGKTYTGKHGLSLKLSGVDPGYNTNADSRAIVLHGAPYVNENIAKCYGRIGRSLGCPAVPVEKTSSIIEMVKNGSVLFVCNQNKSFSSGYLKDRVALEMISKEI
jgi:hypothetical protein